MSASDRLAPDVAAKKAVMEAVPPARAAILAGSVVTGHMTSASDLDIVVIADDPMAPFRRSFRHAGWPVEMFVHTPEGIRRWWQLNDEQRRPALALMCARGQIVLDTDGVAARLRQEAQQLLDAGPPPLPAEELALLRYGLTDSLDDLLAGPRDAERPFILAPLLDGLCELAMENRRAFRGNGKWMFRMAEEADPRFAKELSEAISSAEAGDAGPIASLVQVELDKVGGALFDGYRADGRPILESG